MNQQFIPGKWYWYLERDYIMQCERFENNTFYNSAYINTKQRNFTFQNSPYENLEDFSEEAPLSDIQGYLPLNHIDKSPIYKFLL